MSDNDTDDRRPSGPRFIRLPEIERLTSLRPSAIYNRIQAGTFPAPRKLSSRCSVWLESEILAWMHRQPTAASLRDVS